MEVAAAPYDLIVAGAGPAGSACAITAARAGARVLLLDKDRFPRHKVCGEFVSAESLRLLESLLQESLFGSRLEIGSSRIFLDGKTVRLPVAPAALSIPRYDLDAALLQAARRAGVQAEEGVAVRDVQMPAVADDLFHVATSETTFTARAVVNASGRWSQLTKYDAGGQAKWLGLKAHYRESSAPTSVDLYFFPGGYCGVTPLGPDSVNACAMVRADAATTLDRVLAAHPELLARSRNWEPLFAAITTSPLYFRTPVTETNGMICAGDAAGFIDPFAGDGISLALHSGTLAAESLVPFLQGKCSLAQARAQYSAAYARRFTPAFRNAAWLRRGLSAPKWIRSLGLSLMGTRPVAKLIVRKTRARMR
ncbi:MAG: FAD-dependent oxidoreductase [Acidobacteriia bacterium]|nr:FAD-dependent oxidoreductase [Terriglobia bacterium]